MSKQKPDYSFDRGLRIETRQFADNFIDIKELELSQEALRETPNSGDNPRRDAEVAEEMANPRLIRGLGGVGLECAIIGEENADTVMFVSYGWGGNIRHPVAVNEAQALAANNPDTALVFTNTFGAGRSSLLPRSVAKDLRRTGRYGGMGEHVASIYDQIADGRTIHLRGHSLGARTVVGAAPYLETPAETLIVNDPTGTRKMGLLAIANSFAIKEGGHLKNYLAGGLDPHAADLQNNPVKASVWNTVEGTKGGWKQQFLVDPSGLSKDGFGADFAVAAPTVESLIRIISPELSELNDPQAIADIMALSRETQHPQALLEQYVLHDHTHSVMTLPQALARLYQTDQTDITLAA